MAIVTDLALDTGEVFVEGSMCFQNEEECRLMQFTGLFDKNGKEIWEGDIVACDDGGEFFTYEGHPDYPEKYPIAWNDEGACFYLKGKEDLEVSPFYDYCTLEIIGNIYENPELLTS